MAPLTHLYSTLPFSHIIQKHIFSVAFSGVVLYKTVVLFFALVSRYPSLTFLLSPQYNGCELNFLCVARSIEKKWHLENSTFLNRLRVPPHSHRAHSCFWQKCEVCEASAIKRTVTLLSSVDML